MTSPQPRIMLWVDGERVELWYIGPDTTPRRRLHAAVVDWPGLVVDQETFDARECYMLSAVQSAKAKCVDPLVEAMHALGPMRLDWQDVTTRSAVATL